MDALFTVEKSTFMATVESKRTLIHPLVKNWRENDPLKFVCLRIKKF